MPRRAAESVCQEATRACGSAKPRRMCEDYVVGTGDAQPVEALDGGGGGAGALLRDAVVGEHGAADDVGLPVHARDAHAIVAGAADDASRMRAMALHTGAQPHLHR